MSNDRISDAERLACEIFTRTMSAWNAVHTFRWMGQLGLPHATNQAAWQHERTCQHLASEDKFAELFTGDRQKLVDLRVFENAAKAMTEQSVIAFSSALDAASLILGHSVLDSAAFDWCRVCALAEPTDFMRDVRDVGQKRVTLSEVQGAASFSELRDTAIKDYLDKLERQSIIEKLDLILRLCRPPPDFVAIEKYRYDRERIVALDKLRHDYAHRGLGRGLPGGDDDLWFLCKTTDFLLLLVNQRHRIRLDPVLCSLMFAGQPSEPAKA